MVAQCHIKNKVLGHTLTKEFEVSQSSSTRYVNPGSTAHRANAGLMLLQRRRRWTNIKRTLAQCVVFTEK